MNIYSSLEAFRKTPGSVVTLGTFDGMHLGHQRIIQRLKETARRQSGHTVVITFSQHPRMVLYPDDNQLKLLSTPEEKIRLMEDAGIDNLLIIPFTKEFSRISAEEFVRDILYTQIGADTLVIGYDHRFGKNREGSMQTLEELVNLFPMKLEEIPPHEIDEITISSTKIRNFISEGDVEHADRLLGRPYELSGEVIHGDQRGRTIGYPTANLGNIPAYKLIPADGVYAVRVKYGNDWYKGMMNIGFRPTVDGRHHAVEVNIFDFDKDIYGQILTVQFIKRLRGEMRFANINELKTQLEWDRMETLSLL